MKMPHERGQVRQLPLQETSTTAIRLETEQNGENLKKGGTVQHHAPPPFKSNELLSESSLSANSKSPLVMRTLSIQSVECNKLTDIDIIGQRFKVELVVTAAFLDGAHDPDLSDLSGDFPMGANGRPTFRPGARWFANQVDFNNALESKFLDSQVMIVDDDIIVILRFEGTFSEQMELQNFPCDVQDLTISLAVNCRKSGMMPLQIVNARSLKTGILPGSFIDDKMWHLEDSIRVVPGYTGANDDRLFPSLDMKLFIGRQPDFVLLNIALPIFFFVPLATLQFCVPRQVIDGRLSVSLAIVLTAVAHKFTMTAMVPPVSYLTLLDKYFVTSFGLILLITFQGGLLGSLESFYCRTQLELIPFNETGEVGVGSTVVSRRSTATGDVLDNYRYRDPDCPGNLQGLWGSNFDYIEVACLALDVGLWLLLQLWAAWRYAHLQRADDRVRLKQVSTTSEPSKASTLRMSGRRQ